ncbi:hypothetical protein FE257_004252 [Aspergillus nanangensis]|uniref:Dihydrolipoamide acetyltransferase component of pyruvate dehydrogenase complex n=1 Tax=Aspergillus nanangensis TaxID=2582783 RepID=A0AAD4CRT9_ASPNN|nr:hypothetical protein FE257_004252 [Aspergillus nanangensis]
MNSILLRGNFLRQSRIPRKSTGLSLFGGSLLRGRSFHNTPCRRIVKPYLLADIGEGITECRVVSWFVKPGDRVNQFDAICEVQSDKASVEITSRYDGTITALHHEVDEMAIVGKPLLDVDVDEEISAADEDSSPVAESPNAASESPAEMPIEPSTPSMSSELLEETPEPPAAKNSGLSAPSVKHLLKEHNLLLEDIPGTGKGGRVLKEDVQRYVASQAPPAPSAKPTISPPPEAQSTDQVVELTPNENQMCRVMTAALTIPHFGFSHSVDFTALNTLRQKFNKNNIHGQPTTPPKLTALPIVMKALSLAFSHHPKLNSHFNPESETGKPRLTIKGSHDFGIAVDTPQGLVVPVVRDVQNRSILSIAGEIKRLSDLAKQGKLTPGDMKGATFTVSNIGSIGGSVVNPVIVPPMVAIVAMGKTEEVVVLTGEKNEKKEVSTRQKTVLSWSADHRVLDGAAVARCAEMVGRMIEEVDGLGVILK